MNKKCSQNGCSEPAKIFDSDGGYCHTHWDEMWAAKQADEKQATEDAGGPWPQTCPRRIESVGPWEQGEDLDQWDIREQMHKGLRARHCSFCGSLHPDDFMRLIKEGWKVEPTDKSYKAYLGSSGDDRPMQTKFYYQHLSEDQKREFVNLYNEKRMVVSDGGFYRLPFFMTRATS